MSDYQDSVRVNVDMSQVASVHIDKVNVGDAGDAPWFKIHLTGRDGLKATINVFGAYDTQGNRGAVTWDVSALQASDIVGGLAPAPAPAPAPAFSGPSDPLPKALTPFQRLRANWYMRQYGKRVSSKAFFVDGPFVDGPTEAAYQRSLADCDATE